MTENTALGIMAISLIIETIVVVAFAVIFIYAIFKLKKSQDNFKRRFETSQLSENINKISISIDAILSDINGITKTVRESVKDIKTSTETIAEFFYQLNYISKSLSKTADMLSELPNSINDSITHSVESIKSKVENESSELYIGIKAVMNALRNVIKRRKDVHK